MKHLDLEIKEQSFDKASKTISTSLEQSDFQAFEKLHNKTFLEKYYNADAKKNRERFNNENVLKVLKTDSRDMIRLKVIRRTPKEVVLQLSFGIFRN